jgi:hypothetical protein
MYCHTGNPSFGIHAVENSTTPSSDRRLTEGTDNYKSSDLWTPKKAKLPPVRCACRAWASDCSWTNILGVTAHTLVCSHGGLRQHRRGQRRLTEWQAPPSTNSFQSALESWRAWPWALDRGCASFTSGRLLHGLNAGACRKISGSKNSPHMRAKTFPTTSLRFPNDHGETVRCKQQEAK